MEVVLQGNAATRRGDWETVAATLDPHILVRTDPRWPEQYIYGREAVIAWYQEVTEPGGTDISIEETMDLGDRVLVRLCWRVHGLRSGVEGEQRLSVISTFREGRVILEEFFLEHEQALKALGLEESPVSANLDLVRSIFADWERGDYFSRADWVDPEIELVLVGGPDPQSLKGATEVAEGWREFLSQWQGYRIKAEEYSQLDGERVLVLFRVSGRGRTSGLELGQFQQRPANVFHVREGKVTRLVTYLDRDRAFADLGLEE